MWGRGEKLKRFLGTDLPEFSPRTTALINTSQGDLLQEAITLCGLRNSSMDMNTDRNQEVVEIFESDEDIDLEVQELCAKVLQSQHKFSQKKPFKEKKIKCVDKFSLS
jgi:hypothetical protein